MNRFLVFVVFSMLAFCSGCVESVQFYKGSTQLSGERLRSDKPVIYNCVMLIAKPAKGWGLDLGVIFRNGQRVDLNDVTITLLYQHGKVERIDDPDETRYVVDDILFYASQDRIVGMQACDAALITSKPLIFRLSDGKTYTLPLSEHDAIELFGQPDKVEAAHLW